VSSPRLLQGIFEFEGQGLDKPSALEPPLSYTVPVGNEAQFVYFRGGNTSAELVCAIVVRDGEPMRYFPIGARAATHVALRVVEDLLAETEIEIRLVAPAGASGHVIIDVGLVEI
jgi:assimilatory nitrate reductase catalytic subunit